MKKLQNSLYVTRQESYLHKERETIVIKQGKDKLAQFPAHAVANIFCFGQISVSPFLMGYCGEQGIGLVFFTEYGKFLARIQGRQSGNVLLRREQYRVSDKDALCLDIARSIVLAKIANSRRVLQREVRNKGAHPALDEAIARLANCLRRCERPDSLDVLRGLEGEAAAIYFGVFNQLLKQDGFEFKGRVRRPPTDPVNALLSFLYTLVTQEISSALQGVGLDPYVGYLHVDRPGRVGLALDILEEFRAWWCDRLALTLINRKEVKTSDFDIEASGAVRLKEDARRKVLVAYQEKKQEEISHPFLNEKVQVGLLPHCQALILARHLRGDLQHYPPFSVR
ncbi:type I-C CRISPR-associated endonuclease Cas1c [Hahella aquimaris]|uniref:type I-C CRISPR-associated endonuclease Cas1c n=1 Tax=Hahella sp. HNIBRBA332 TaxID=3015983 RepID=UPI00273AAA78|nr:type I-C CRISPR-associated endonuclease Cas1c [Hahella sp. HNIBRBA332]WLQ16767.1 type I-C CRISPR-associated endonuclease Cas1c [Hahella sp. HNIBRBA332]